MYGWLEYWRVEDGWAARTRSKERIFSEPFFSSQNLPAYITSQTPTKILVLAPSPACRLHILRDQASFQREHLYPVYFRY